MFDRGRRIPYKRARQLSSMTGSKRAFPRYRADVVLDFTIAESRITGLTWDVSLGGMFVRTTRMPEVGQKLLVNLRFPEGRQLLIQAEVVRTFQPSVLVRGSLPAGFAVTVKEGESYKRFVESVAAGSQASA